jgi:hypothetical protein
MVVKPIFGMGYQEKMSSMHLKAISNIPPPIDEELRLIGGCKLLGSKINRLWDYVRNNKPIQISENVVRYLANELDNIQDKSVWATAMQAIARPEYREIVLLPISRNLRREGQTVWGQRAANDLAKIIQPQDIELIVNLLRDRSITDARALLVSQYARIAKKSAIPVLRSLVDDPETRTEALKSLSKLGDITIEYELLELAKHPDSYHRKIAREALARVEKNKAKHILSNKKH